MSWLSDLKAGFDRWLDQIFQRGTATNMSQIAIDVDKARGVLKQLMEKVEEVREQKRQLETLSANTELCWQGASGDALREHLTLTIKEQKTIADEMEGNILALQELIDTVVERDQTLARLISECGEPN